MIHKQGLGSVVLATCVLALTLGDSRAEKPFDSYPQAARESYVKAEELREKGQFREALAGYEEAGKQGLTGYAKLYLRQADCQRQLREHNKVVETYTRLIEDLGLERSCRICLLEALRVRSAAYAALENPERALADLTTIVLLHEADLAIRQELKSNELGDLLRETAKAHRDRAQLHEIQKHWDPALVDHERAKELERQTANKTTEKPNAWIRLVNEWNRRVTVEVDGEVHELQAGAEKKWRRTPGAFTYTVREVGTPVTSRAEEGKMTTIRIYTPQR